mgnify:CR=1 FL=1
MKNIKIIKLITKLTTNTREFSDVNERTKPLPVFRFCLLPLFEISIGILHRKKISRCHLRDSLNLIRLSIGENKQTKQKQATTTRRVGEGV